MAQLTDFWLNRPAPQFERHLQQARADLGIPPGTQFVALSLRRKWQFNFDSLALQMRFNTPDQWRVWGIERVPALLNKIGIRDVLVMYDYQETLEDLNRLMENSTEAMKSRFRIFHTSFERMSMKNLGWEPHNQPSYLASRTGLVQDVLTNMFLAAESACLIADFDSKSAGQAVVLSSLLMPYCR